MKILAIESTCDETAAAVVEDGRRILSSAVASQIEIHKRFGGVVPEIASRCHVENICGVTEEALRQAAMPLAGVDAVAVTAAPGLIGAVLVGVNFAKGLCFATGKPLIPVHHIRGHVAANYLTYADPPLEPPFLCLIVSGGHSHIVRVRDYTEYEILGRTLDDAAGEAFDKAARTLGIGYPGGPQLDRIAHDGNPHAYRLPTPHLDTPYDFSFSGIKTAVINTVHNAQQKGEPVSVPDMAASFCAKVAEILWEKLEAAALACGETRVVLAGGVSANSWLRARAEAGCKKRGWQLFAPQLPLCGDNAAMIAAQAYYEFLAGHTADLSLNGRPSMDITDYF